jgi:hypothetical protein
MEPISTIAITITTIFLTKALEKSGEIFSKAVIEKMGQVIKQIRYYSPETAMAIEAGDVRLLNSSEGLLDAIPPDPIFAEFMAVAEAEQNALFQTKLLEVKASKILQVMASDIEAVNLKAKSMKQIVPKASSVVEQIMLSNVNISGDIDLGDLIQE